MDAFLLLMTLLSCFIYIFMQAVVFRFIHEDRALIWLLKLYCMILGVSLIAGYLSGFLTVQIITLHGILFTLFVVSYIQSVFSFFEASITMRLLTEISGGGKRGVTEDQILKRYNRNIIVRRRVERLIASGDITMHKSVYRLNRRISPFIIRMQITDLTKFLFPPKR